MTWINLEPEAGWKPEEQARAAQNCKDVTQYCPPFMLFAPPDSLTDTGCRWTVTDELSLNFTRSPYFGLRWYLMTYTAVGDIGDSVSIDLEPEAGWATLRKITRHRAAVCLARGDDKIWTARYIHSATLNTLK